MAFDERIYDLMVDVAWKGIEGTQKSIIELENKAYNVMALSGVLITAIVGILVGLFDKIPPYTSIFLIIDLVILFTCIVFAFRTVFLQKQELLDSNEAFKGFDFTNAIKSKGIFALSVNSWQERAIKTTKNKSESLLISMLLFIGALIFTVIIAIATIYLLNT